MSFTFLAQIPDTPGGNSPTVWRDEDTGDLIVQGYVATAEDYVQADSAGSTPGHRHDAASVHAAGEAVVRLPASIVSDLKATLA
jgi:hypothetical protein